jgi:hypothetical protein
MRERLRVGQQQVSTFRRALRELGQRLGRRRRGEVHRCAYASARGIRFGLVERLDVLGGDVAAISARSEFNLGMTPRTAVMAT